VSELLYGSPVHRPLTSSEIVEWAAELRLRNEDEKKAYERDDDEDGVPVETDAGSRAAAQDSMPAEVDAAIVRAARERGYID
jgi:hypothetical protein